MEVTEKYLSDIGGWQAMKSARESVRALLVSDPSRQGNVFRGQMSVNGRKMQVTLDLQDPRRITCKCACRAAQQGMICAHGLAVALANLEAARPELASRTPSAPRSGGYASSSKSQAALSSKELKYPTGKLSWFLGMDQWGRLPSGSIPVFVKFEPDTSTYETELAPWMLDQGIAFKTGSFRLTGPQLAPFLKRLLEHPRVSSGKPTDKSTSTMEVSGPMPLPVEVELEGSKYVFRAMDETHRMVELGSKAWFWDEKQNRLSHAVQSSAESSSDWQRFLLDVFSGTRRPIQRSRAWVIEHLLALKQQFQTVGENALGAIRVQPYPAEFVVQLDGNFKGLRALLQVKLPTHRHVATAKGEDAHYPLQDAAQSQVFYVRNHEREAWAVSRLERFGFSPHPHGYWELLGEREVMEFYASKLASLQRSFEVEEGPQWTQARKGVLAIQPLVKPQGTARDAQPNSGQDWLSLEVDYVAADGFRIPRNEVLRLIRSGKRDMNASNGKRYLLDIEACEDLEETLQDAESRLDGGGKGFALRANRLAVLGDFTKDRETLLQSLKQPKQVAQANISKALGSLNQVLRPYQSAGVQWLLEKAKFAGGALLADEMGLGKTLQTLAFLKSLKHEAKSAAPSLIVCPSSLLSNWKDEAEKFVPEFKVHISHELGRKQYFEVLGQFDLVITSYALVVRDLEVLQKIEFDAVILDEASYIRNPDTESSKAVKALSSRCRVALTGTPVENSVKDLWSIFQFSLPRYLPAQERFHERFVKPLQSAMTSQPEEGRQIMQRLRRLVQPYMLRRTKREVAKELPEKIEKVLWAELTREQKEVYQRLLEEGRQEIRDAKKRSGKGAARMTMFTLLLRMRQICNDLRLLKTPGLENQVGGKWDVLEETFQELINGGHKAIVFSQFVGMLHLLRDKLDAMGISYSYLDGSSQDRAQQVSDFQKEKKTQFFLISLKAGGYGLTLTEADHVMLVDPWWNPAVEAQAIDRAHRIGQEKPVTAYRVITRGTVEEKILKLQESKRKVIDMALEDDPSMMSGLSDEELEALFED